nr:MAG TPA: hypothetical protein [Caudoviricetes sp.]
MIKYFDGAWEATSDDIQALPNFDIVHECFCEEVADNEKRLGRPLTNEELDEKARFHADSCGASQLLDLIADELVDLWKHDREAA